MSFRTAIRNPGLDPASAVRGDKKVVIARSGATKQSGPRSLVRQLAELGMALVSQIAAAEYDLAMTSVCYSRVIRDPFECIRVIY